MAVDACFMRRRWAQYQQLFQLKITIFTVNIINLTINLNYCLKIHTVLQSVNNVKVTTKK
jgi:hypothetical protein